MTTDELDKQRTIIYTWVSKAYYRNLTSMTIPEKFSEAAKEIASQGNGFHFDGSVLSWD
jgi:hypothetical protein